MEDKNFYKFPPEDPRSLSGVFNDNIGLFIERHGILLPNRVDGMRIWLIPLQKDGKTVPLYVAESILNESGEAIKCEHCCSSGWSHHFVSKKRYRLIVPRVQDWSKPNLEEGFSSSLSHQLHVLLHSNGYGHLILINGIETGMSAISGRDLMYLLDRICYLLRVRKVSVWDTSQKHSMEVRLLYGVTYGQPWFAKWNYKFSNGTSGITEELYNAAISRLGSLALDNVLDDFGSSRVSELIQHYREISNIQLMTVKELLQLMVFSKTQTKKIPWPTLTPVGIINTAQVTEDHKKLKWEEPDIVDATEYIATILRTEGRPMLRSELSDKTKDVVRDKGLRDHVIARIENLVYKDGYCIKRSTAQKAHVYSVVRGDGNSEVAAPPKAFGIDTYSDIQFFYKEVLHNYPLPSRNVNVDAQLILNSRCFVKEWPLYNDTNFRYICCLEKDELWSTARGEQVVVLRRSATYQELVTAAQKALRDTFYATHNFVVTGMGGQENKSSRINNVVVSLVFNPNSEVIVVGEAIDLETAFKYEGGVVPNDVVNCTCGTQNFDEEEMWECTNCKVMHHARCTVIDSAGMVSEKFLCQKCYSNM